MTDRKLQRLQNRRLWHGETLTRFGEQYKKLQDERDRQSMDIAIGFRTQRLKLDARLAKELNQPV
ncbi:MAG TPA: hypothetical protein VFN56_03990 [Candidatus Saccharimonadales bacterium]|nr:hypothetical protein [Candidatus Saccharimonadales bacterium]